MAPITVRVYSYFIYIYYICMYIYRDTGLLLLINQTPAARGESRQPICRDKKHDNFKLQTSLKLVINLLEIDTTVAVLLPLLR